MKSIPLNIKPYYLAFIFLFQLNTFIKAGNDNLIISEVCSINGEIIADETGEYVDWIEIYNTGTDAVNLFGLYISDDPYNILKWQIQAVDLVVQPGAYFLLWADDAPSKGSKHLGFKISEGEKVILYNPNFGIIDSLRVKSYLPDISAGRKTPEKDAEIVYYETPSPGYANSQTFYNGIAGKPVFDNAGGFYNAGIEVKLNSHDPNNKIYYTLNSHGPVPGENGTFLYNDSVFKINTTTIIRAVGYQDGYISSPIVSHAYYINTNYALPVLSIITDPDNLYGPKGIYENYEAEGIEWERFAQHQYFNQEKQLLFDVNSGIRIQGGTSVFRDKKSFRLHFRSEYGFNRFDYPLFLNSGLGSFKHLVLKAGYDDDLQMYTGTLLRDALSTELWRQLEGHFNSGSEWAVLLLNGQYWGIYNIRESIDEEFLIDKLGHENFDMVRFLPEQPDLKFGEWDEWYNLDANIKYTNFSTTDGYNTANALIDLDLLTDLLAFIHCSQYRSWTWGVSCYREKTKDSKWEWLIWDTDRAYTDLYWNGFYEYGDHPEGDRDWPNIIPYNLLNSKTFERLLINKTADLLNSTFVPEHAVAVLDSLKNIVAPEIENERTRWSSNISWGNNVNSMVDFLENRPQVVIDQMLSYFNLNNAYTLNLKMTGKGKIEVNSLTITAPNWNGTYFASVPIKLKAIPANGYVFNGWGNGIENTTIYAYDATYNTSLTADFIIDTTTVHDIKFTEIMYHPAPGNGSGEWIEIYNGGKGANISNWWITDGNENHKFIIPDGTYVNSKEYLVIARDLMSFLKINQNTESVTGSFGDGASGFGLNFEGECIRLFRKDSTLIDEVCFTNKFPWPVNADGLGPSLQLMDPGLDNDLPGNWATSKHPLYTPGKENIFDSTIAIIDSGEFYIGGIYPNPCNDFIYFDHLKNEEMEYTIYSFEGRVVKRGIVEKNNQRIDIRDLRDGIYVARIQRKESGSNRIFRVMVQHK